MLLFHEGSIILLARECIVAEELHEVLVAVELEDIQLLSVGCPGEVGHVVRQRLGILQPDGLPGGDVVDSHADVLRLLARHGIFVHVGGGYALGDVHLRIAGDAALVFLVEGQSLSVGAPEESAGDTEFVATDAVAVDDVVVAVGRQLPACAVGCLDIDVGAYAVGHVPALGVPDELAGSFLDLSSPFHSLALEVNQDDFLGRLQLHDGQGGVGELHIRTGPHHLLAEDGIEVVGREEGALPFAIRKDAHRLLHRQLHGHLSPPGGEHILRLEVPVGGASSEQVVQRKAFLRGLRHRRHGGQQQGCQQSNPFHFCFLGKYLVTSRTLPGRSGACRPCEGRCRAWRRLR